MKLLDVVTSPWAILPDKLIEIREIYATHLRGDKIDLAAVEARLGRPLNNDPKGYDVVDGVAILPLDGVISPRANLFTRVSGGTSTQLFSQELKRIAADPSVRATVIEGDTPGGSVYGIQTAAADVRALAAQMPVVVFTDGTLASAGYWIAAAADQIFISGKTTAVGSIGVVATHLDMSSAEAKSGVKTTEIVAGKYKRIASQYAPLTEEGRKVIQDQVDYLYAAFVEDVAAYRGVSVDQVLADMADGRVFIGTQAIDAGLADGVSSLDALIADLAAGRFTPRRTQQRSAGVALPPSTSSTGVLMDMTKEKLIAEHPAIAQALREEAVSAAAPALRAEGAIAERTRIQQVEAQAMPGHEALIASLKFDGKTTGPEAAVQVLAAERAFLEQRAAQQGSDAPPPIPGAASATGMPPPPKKEAPDASLSVEERAKKTWESDAGVRSEFTSLEAYTAFEKAHASGRVKVLGAAR